MKDCYQDVLDFHTKFGCPTKDKPGCPTPDIVSLRRRLVFEEINELIDAIDAADLAGIADSIVDSIYVLLGTAIVYGIDLCPVWDAVQAANIAKVGGGKRDDGKIMKPPGWKPPDICAVLAAQGNSMKELIEHSKCRVGLSR